MNYQQQFSNGQICTAVAKTVETIGLKPQSRRFGTPQFTMVITNRTKWLANKTKLDISRISFGNQQSIRHLYSVLFVRLCTQCTCETLPYTVSQQTVVYCFASILIQNQLQK
ncbi:Hypothetical_protein [Hexamita inflata]|uniref:Hypothetical_protein n=1 Tax=Hexamita inflata TaxID=28002 RepID=A0AA86PX72_9EUKA|nr:Hypothetical protein HINF_LOCUS35690 [Hexamita inflata]